MKYGLLFLCFLISAPAICQEGQIDPETSYSKNYVRLLIYGDSSTRCSLVNFSYKFLVNAGTEGFAFKGAHLGLGLNIARFFTDKFIAGVCIETKQWQGGLKQQLPAAFREEFAAYLQPVTGNEDLENAANVLEGGISGQAGYSITGNGFSAVGIQLSPFPDRYGGLMLTISRGGGIFSFNGPPNEIYHPEKGGSYLDLSMRRDIGMELCMSPYKFLRFRERESLADPSYRFILRAVTVSFYYERLSFSRSRFYTEPLSTFVTSGFFTGMKPVKNIGFKIGFGIQ